MGTSVNSVQMREDFVQVGGPIRRWAFTRALARANERFADQYPAWAESLFDEHFLTHGAAPLMSSYLNGGGSPDSGALARAWAEQLCWPKQETRRKRIAQLTPIIAHFLQMLEAELGM